MILELGGIEVREMKDTYDLAFRAKDKKRKPSFATFVTHTHKAQGKWNKNEIEDSVVVQVRLKDITDPDKIENPKDWKIFFKEIDRKKGWFSFRLTNAKSDTIKYAFNLVKQAYDSF